MHFKEVSTMFGALLGGRKCISNKSPRCLVRFWWVVTAFQTNLQNVWCVFPVASCGLQWLPVASCGVLWRPVASCGFLWPAGGSWGFLWSPVASCGFLGPPGVSWGAPGASSAPLGGSWGSHFKQVSTAFGVFLGGRTCISNRSPQCLVRSRGA